VNEPSNLDAWNKDAPVMVEEKPTYYNAGDKKQVNEKRTKKGREDFRIKNIVLDIMQTSQGREYFYGLLEFCHIWRLTFDPENQSITCFREGERNVGLKVLADINQASPDLYHQMCREMEDLKK